MRKLATDNQLNPDVAEKFYKTQMKSIDDFLGPQYCAICDDPIQNSVKIRSFVHSNFGQHNKPLVACLKCHRTCMPITETDKARQSSPSKAVSIGDYLVLDNLQFTLFHPDWSAREEVLLLQGVSKCGLGNWKGISEQYVKSKEPEDCEEHYFTFYYKSKEECMPVENDLIVQGPRVEHPTKDMPENIDFKAPIDLVKAR